MFHVSPDTINTISIHVNIFSKKEEEEVAPIYSKTQYAEFASISNIKAYNLSVQNATESVTHSGSNFNLSRGTNPLRHMRQRGVQ